MAVGCPVPVVWVSVANSFSIRPAERCCPMSLEPGSRHAINRRPGDALSRAKTLDSLETYNRPPRPAHHTTGSCFAVRLSETAAMCVFHEGMPNSLSEPVRFRMAVGEEHITTYEQ